MSRLQLALNVDDIDAAVEFYSTPVRNGSPRTTSADQRPHP